MTDVKNDTPRLVHKGLRKTADMQRHKKKLDFDSILKVSNKMGPIIKGAKRVHIYQRISQQNVYKQNHRIAEAIQKGKRKANGSDRINVEEFLFYCFFAHTADITTSLPHPQRGVGNETSINA